MNNTKKFIGPYDKLELVRDILKTHGAPSDSVSVSVIYQDDDYPCSKILGTVVVLDTSWDNFNTALEALKLLKFEEE